jgi:hypothetical protein
MNQTQATNEGPVPRNTHKVRQFVGHVDYYRKIMKNCTDRRVNHRPIFLRKVLILNGYRATTSV